jgi:hypothetical protein
MRCIVMIKANKDSEAGKMPEASLLTAMAKYNEELLQAGILQGGEGLHPSAKGKRVQFVGDKRTVIDGPFSETKELIAGFWMWKVKSMDEAVEWVKRCPTVPGLDSEIEIRAVFESEEFTDMTPETRALEDSQRARLTK